MPLGRHDELAPRLASIYGTSTKLLDDPAEKLFLHHEEFGDRLLGVLAGYLLYSRLVEHGPHAISVIEKLTARSLGADGREMVAVTLERHCAVAPTSCYEPRASGADDAHGVGAPGALAGRRGHDRDEIAVARDARVARRLHRVPELRRRLRRVRAASGRTPHTRLEPAEHLGLRRRCRRSAPTGRNAATRRAVVPLCVGHTIAATPRSSAACTAACATAQRDPVVVDRGGRARGVVRARGHASAASATSPIVRTVSAG